MTDKEFRKLNRADLVNIIYEMQKNEQAMKAELEEARKALDSRNMKIAEAGSIAEAVVGLNEIFERAQKAADEYLEQVHVRSAEQEQMIADAEKKGADIISKAQYEADQIIARAEREVGQKWEAFNQQVNEMLKAHSELEGKLKG